MKLVKKMSTFFKWIRFLLIVKKIVNAFKVGQGRVRTWTVNQLRLNCGNK